MELDQEGKIVREFYDMGGDSIIGVSEVLDMGGDTLYLGSYETPYIRQIENDIIETLYLQILFFLNFMNVLLLFDRVFILDN